MTHGDGLFGLDSRFGAAALPAGTYVLQYHGSAWPPPINVIPEVSGVKVVVDGRDITDVRVVPIRMVTSTGRIILDGRALPSSTITVGSQPIDFDGNPGPTRPGVVADDRTFSFKSWPGVAIVRVDIRGLGWTLKRISHRGADITNTPIEFVEGKDMSGIEIELEHDGTPPVRP